MCLGPALSYVPIFDNEGGCGTAPSISTGLPHLLSYKVLIENHGDKRLLVSSERARIFGLVSSWHFMDLDATSISYLLWYTESRRLGESIRMKLINTVKRRHTFFCFQYNWTKKQRKSCISN
ncbi:uncharacterized protein [Atheta coriaria]|uniref:uncharacterized protein n=1 Tax=Dalotia coriaria TaxID=877792 RepID=UPI0031F36DE9